MRTAIACGACAWVLLAGIPSAKAEDKADQDGGSLVGKKVIAIRPDVVLRTEPADDAKGAGLIIHSRGIAAVEAEQNGWLSCQGYWLRRSDAVLLSEAVAYFSEQIEQSPTAYAYVARRRALRVEKQDLERALADAEAAVQMDPSFALAWLCRGECRHDAKLHAEAIADCTRALELDPQLHLAQVQRAMSRRDAEDFDGAIDDCTAGLQRWPHSDDLLSSRAAAYYGRGIRRAAEQRLELAERDFKSSIADIQATRHTPRTHRPLHFPAAEAAERARDLEIDRKLAAIRVQLGGVRFYVGDFKAAIGHCSEAIRLNPEHFAAYLNRGSTLQRLGKDSDALADLNQAIRLKPDNGEAHAGLGYALTRLKDYPRAIEHFSQAMSLLSKSADLLLARGQANFWRGAYRLAASDFAAAIRLDPKNAESFHWRGKSLKELDDKDAALKDFNRAIELDPRDKFSRIDRASLLDDLGKEEQALADCNTAIELDPNWSGGYGLRGCILSAQGKHRESLDDLTRAISFTPNCWPLYGLRSLAWRELGEPAKAIEDLNMLIRHEPADPSYYRQRAETWRSMRKFLKAKRDFAEAKRLEAEQTAKRTKNLVR